MELESNQMEWDQDKIFLTLSKPMRRKLLLAIARNGSQTAASLAPISTHPHKVVRLNNIVKNLTALRDSGLIKVYPNPVDERKQLYGLAPGIKVTKTETGCAVNISFNGTDLNLLRIEFQVRSLA